MRRMGEKAMRRRRRKLRVRKRVLGTPARPRLTVFRSHKNVYAQIVDDLAGRTLVAASTMEGPLREKLAYGGNRPAASAVGTRLAEKAIKAGIKKVVFDRNGYAYHGRVKELADAARKGGLEF
jgi:large subunit ribosomal protein L18